MLEKGFFYNVINDSGVSNFQSKDFCNGVEKIEKKVLNIQQKTVCQGLSKVYGPNWIMLSILKSKTFIFKRRYDKG